MKKISLLCFLGLAMMSCKKNHDQTEPVENNIDYHQTAQTKFAQVDNVKFAYRTLGEKPGIPLVLVASLGSSMDDWDPAVTNGLAQQSKVILFDIEGVGSSTGKTADNIADMAKGAVKFIKAMGYEKVNLMGFSMGSFISQQIILTEPGLVNKLILTGTGPKGAVGLSNLPNLLAASAGLSAEESFLKFAFTSSDNSIAAGKAAWARTLKRTVDRDAPLSPEAGGAELKAVLGWAQPAPGALDELKKVSQPVLIAQGEEDIPLPVVNARNLAKSLPNAKLIVYSDAGHASFFQYHEEFVIAANAFLKN
ncbi:alpha/beta hydrolase [Mucilaginibacter conchicola]|uniref:Alpha/beta hydrolase n=1 Tax=Mucilaginibacter conchicola TaxID=2303333 RepID=A0A372NNP4_9SPHI|nr:alpha/beta hydrolase [Mucilaginibacter conchicola]RFZ90250.1 alpha/beta hydrolase [Mucilaginibacter conchicola]